MFSLIRKHRYFFAITLAAAIALRAFFIWKFTFIQGDSFVYGNIAKNWLTHGIFGMGSLQPEPTYIRLPGYPAFLAATWHFTGLEHYRAVLIIQLLIDLGTCFAVADLARRIASDRAARMAFLLASLCPFLAGYVATPLTETWAIFFAALGLDFAVAGMEDLTTGRLRYWFACGLAVAGGILMRPDGGILLAVIGLFLLLRLVRPESIAPKWEVRKHTVLAGLLVAAVALAPLVPWTIRNWRQFHRFQPLAPRYANAPGEPINEGFQRWVKTWMVDYISVLDIYWTIPAEHADFNALPSRAFDSPQERAATAAIIAEYNEELDWTPELDARIGQIAADRISRNPLRYYVLLPTARIANMWFRPRTAMLGTNDRWWDYKDDPRGTYWSLFMGAINLFLVGAAVWGLLRRNLRYATLLVLFVAVRSLFLGSLENPEPRYTLECYPVVLALAAAALTQARAHKGQALPGPSPSNCR